MPRYGNPGSPPLQNRAAMRGSWKRSSPAISDLYPSVAAQTVWRRKRRTRPHHCCYACYIAIRCMSVSRRRSDPPAGRILQPWIAPCRSQSGCKRFLPPLKSVGQHDLRKTVCDELSLLRLSILRVTTAEQLAGWLWGCSSIGLGNVLSVVETGLGGL
jgi:hypothetical protein